MRDVYTKTEPDDDEVRLTRRRWDIYFVPLIVVATIGGSVGWWFGMERLIVGPVLPLFLWLYLRFVTPRGGLITKRLSAVSGAERQSQFLLPWGIASIIGLIVIATLPMNELLRVTLLAFATVLFFSVLFVWAYHEDKERKRLELKTAPKALCKWEDGEMRRENASLG